MNTVEKVQEHFGGGTWVRITNRKLYAVADDNVGIDEGSDSVTLTTANMPAHTHTRGTMNITGNFTAYSYTVGGSGAISGEKSGNGGSSTGGRSWCTYTLNAANNWTGSTSSVGSSTPFDITGARRRVYVYYREA